MKSIKHGKKHSINNALTSDKSPNTGKKHSINRALASHQNTHLLQFPAAQQNLNICKYQAIFAETSGAAALRHR